MSTESGRPIWLIIPGIVTILLWSIHIYFRSIWGPGSPYRLILTGLLVVSFAWFVYQQVQHLRKVDEYHRQIHFRAMAIAYPISLVVLFAVGFFHAEGLFQGADSRDLFTLMLVTYVIGLTLSFRHYQSE